MGDRDRMLVTCGTGCASRLCCGRSVGRSVSAVTGLKVHQRITCAGQVQDSVHLVPWAVVSDFPEGVQELTETILASFLDKHAVLEPSVLQCDWESLPDNKSP